MQRRDGQATSPTGSGYRLESPVPAGLETGSTRAETLSWACEQLLSPFWKKGR